MPEITPPFPRRYQLAAGTVLIGYWLIMFTGTHWPHVSLEGYPQNFDKVLHFTGYAGFGFLIAVWIFTKHELRPPDYAVAFAVVFVYAIVDEVTQPYFGRECEFGDMVADWIGGSCGMGIFLLAAATIRKLWGSKLRAVKSRASESSRRVDET
jgi:VanZ family protein